MNDYSFGVVVVVKTENETKFLIVHQTNGHWSFPKGHREGEETAEESARRELWEETGIKDAKLDLSKEFYEEYTFTKDGVEYHKKNTFFVGFLDREIEFLPQEAEVSECKYATFEEAMEIFEYEDTKSLLREVVEYLSSVVK